MTCRSKANNSMYVLTISVNKHFKDKERLSHLDYQQKWSSERFWCSFTSLRLCLWFRIDMMLISKFLFSLCLAMVLPVDCLSQLVVNVKNKGGDIIKEIITGNTTSDVVELQFQNTDGTIINQFIDFKSVMSIFFGIVLETLWFEISCFLYKPEL